MTTSSDQRPDILLIMPDQMRGDCMSLENHPVLQTPNIDTIGAQGMHFTRGYTTCPSCVPSRRAMLTSLFPANNGLTGSLVGQEFDHATFPDHLTAAGYHTTLIGSGMHQHPPEKPLGFTDTTKVTTTHYLSGLYADELEAAFPGQGGVASHGISKNGWSAIPWQFPDHWHPTNWS